MISAARNHRGRSIGQLPTDHLLSPTAFTRSPARVLKPRAAYFSRRHLIQMRGIVTSTPQWTFSIGSPAAPIGTSSASEREQVLSHELGHGCHGIPHSQCRRNPRTVRPSHPRWQQRQYSICRTFDRGAWRALPSRVLGSGNQPLSLRVLNLADGQPVQQMTWPYANIRGGLRGLLD